MKYNYGWNMGPRGPMNGRRMRHHPFGGGLMGLFGLIIALHVIVPLIGAAVVTVGAVFAGLAAAFRGILSAFGHAIFSTARAGGMAIGIAIGLIAYRMIRSRKEEEQRAREEEKDTCSVYFTETEEGEVTETENCRSFRA